MSDIIVTVPFKDRELWIQRIDKRVAGSNAKAQQYHDRNLADYNSYGWAARTFLFNKPIFDTALRDALSGIGTIKQLKAILQRNGWETASMEGWIFEWLQEADNERT